MPDKVSAKLSVYLELLTQHRQFEMVTASIVTFHTPPSELRRLLDCAVNSSIDKIIIVDHSGNNDIETLVASFPRTEYFPHENKGYGSGHNVALKRARELKSQYHVILNPDVYWDGDIIMTLRDFMDRNPECGMSMPKIIYPDGSLQYLCKKLPTPMDLFGRRFLPNNKYRERSDMEYELRWSGYDMEMEVPSLSGCFMFLRMDVIRRIGGFDERYFMYCEDMDLCRRIGDISKTMFFPKVTAVHEYEKGSYKNKKLLKLHIASVIKYFNKWGWLFDKTRSERNRNLITKIKESKR